MSLDTESYRLGEAFGELDEELEEWTERLRDAEDGSASTQLLRRHANDVDQQLAGLAYLIEEYGADERVVVSGLDAGDVGRVQDRAAAMRAQRDEPGDIPGARRNVYAAVGLEDAPFLTGENPTLDDRIAAVTSQPIGVVYWIEACADDLSAVGEGNYQPLAERLAGTSED